MKVMGCAVSACAFVLAACEEKRKLEIEIRLDEEKLGRAIGKHLLWESQKLISETIVMKEQELDMTLPSSSSEEEAEGASVSLEITQDGKLYGSKGEDRSLLADEVTPKSLEQTKAWLSRLKAEFQNLSVVIKVGENQPQQSVIDLLNLLSELDINKVAFSN